MFQHSCKFHAFSVWNLHLHTGFSPAAGALRAGNASGRGSGFFVGARRSKSQDSAAAFPRKRLFAKKLGKARRGRDTQRAWKERLHRSARIFPSLSSSPMARLCYLLPLWTCMPPGFREEPKRAPESGFQTGFRAALDLKSSAGRWGTLETAIDFGAFGFILYDTRAGRKRPRIKTSKAHCGRQRGGWA